MGKGEVIDFGKAMRAQRKAKKTAEAVDVEKLHGQLRRMQTMLVALVKREGRVRISRGEIEVTEREREKLAVRIDPEMGTVTLEVVA